MIDVPLGYKTVFAQLSNLDEVYGGSLWRQFRVFNKQSIQSVTTRLID